MTDHATVEIHWRNLPAEDEINDYLNRRCEELAAEFPEADGFDISLQAEGSKIECHAHVAGKRTRLAAHASGASSPRQAAEGTLDKLEKEMRREHDKRIFGARRKAQKAQAKRTP